MCNLQVPALSFWVSIHPEVGVLGHMAIVSFFEELPDYVTVAAQPAVCEGPLSSLPLTLVFFAV